MQHERGGEGLGKKAKMNQLQKRNIVNCPLRNMERKGEGFAKKAKMNQLHKCNGVSGPLSYKESKRL